MRQPIHPYPYAPLAKVADRGAYEAIQKATYAAPHLVETPLLAPGLVLATTAAVAAVAHAVLGLDWARAHDRD